MPEVCSEMFFQLPGRGWNLKSDMEPLILPANLGGNWGRQRLDGRLRLIQMLGEMVLEPTVLLLSRPCCLLSEHGPGCPAGPPCCQDVRSAIQLISTALPQNERTLERFSVCFLFPLWLLTKLEIVLKLVAVTRKLFQLLIVITLLLINKYDYAPLSWKDLSGFDI